MSGIFPVLAVGWLLGMRHATDPDHVVAISTIVSREPSMRQAAWIGALWGIGHTLTILVVGSGILLFGLAIPPRVGLAMELSVGLMLILLGALNLTGAMRWISEKLTPTHPSYSGAHAHFHSHDGRLHFHSHAHAPESPHHGDGLEPPAWMRNPFLRLGLYQTLRPLLVGIVHGLAGSAAVALLVLSAIRDPRWGVAYLLIFGAGTIAGMIAITVAIAFPITAAGKYLGWMNRGMSFASGLLSVAFGAFLSYHVGFVEGLFTS